MTAFDRPAPVLNDPGWFPDPLAQHHLRYFDGREWTDHVTHRGPEPCAGCHTDDGGAGPLASQPPVENLQPKGDTAVTDVNRRPRAPDRRRVRGRGDASRR